MLVSYFQAMIHSSLKAIFFLTLCIYSLSLHNLGWIFPYAGPLHEASRVVDQQTAPDLEDIPDHEDDLAVTGAWLDGFGHPPGIKIWRACLSAFIYSLPPLLPPPKVASQIES